MPDGACILEQPDLCGGVSNVGMYADASWGSGAGDTRETPAIDVCKGLMEEGAKLRIYDPQVTYDQIKQDLSLAPFEWDRPGNTIPKQYAPSPHHA